MMNSVKSSGRSSSVPAASFRWIRRATKLAVGVESWGKFGRAITLPRRRFPKKLFRISDDRRGNFGKSFRVRCGGNRLKFSRLPFSIRTRQFFPSRTKGSVTIPTQFMQMQLGWTWRLAGMSVIGTRRRRMDRKRSDCDNQRTSETYGDEFNQLPFPSEYPTIQSIKWAAECRGWLIEWLVIFPLSIGTSRSVLPSGCRELTTWTSSASTEPKTDCNVRVGRNFRTRKSCKDGDSKVTVPADVLTRNVPVQSRNFFYGVAGDECRRWPKKLPQLSKAITDVSTNKATNRKNPLTSLLTRNEQVEVRTRSDCRDPGKSNSLWAWIFHVQLSNRLRSFCFILCGK